MNSIPTAKNRRVLVIDDNRAIHDDFRKILCPAPAGATALEATEVALFGQTTETVVQTQFEVDSAYQGQEGVQLARDAINAGRPYAVAFVDVRMPPGWDGVQTTGKLWELDRDLQIVLCTAYADYSWEEIFEELGQRDGLLILKKPFDNVEALQLAQALTEKWWLHQQSQRKMEELEVLVSERTRELARSLSLLNATLESTTDGIVAVNLADQVVSFNSKFRDTWKFPAGMLARGNAAEMRAHTAAQVKDPAGFLQRLKELQADPERENFEVIELRDGRVFERYVFPQRVGRECVGTVINWRDITERKRAEEELRRKTAFLEAQVNSSIDGILVVDPEGKTSLSNQRMADLFKMPPAIANEPNDGNRLRWVAGMLRNPEQFAEKVAYLYAHPEEISREEIELNDGTVLDRYSAPALGHDGKYYGRIWTFRDITERKNFEAELRASEARFAGAFQFAPIGIALVLPNDCFSKVNRPFCDLLGYQEADLLRRTFRDITYPEDLESSLENIRRLRAGEIPAFETEKRYLHRDGRLITALTTVSLVRDDHGQPLYIIAQIQDITQRKQAEDALRESNEKFRQLADNITDVFWIRSADMRTLHYLSPAYERIWGRSVASMLTSPQSWVDFIQPEDRERVRAAFATLAQGAAGLDIEYRIVRPDGVVRWVHVRVFQVRDAAGELIRHTGIVTDITDRREIEEALRRQQAELRVLFDLMPAMILFKDTKNNILRVNQRVAENARKTVAEIEGRPTHEIFPREAARFFADDLEVIHSRVAKLGIVGTVRDPAGKEHWIQTDKVPVCDSDGNPVGIVVMAQDITERRRAEEMLRLLGSAVQQSTEAITITDAELDLPGPRIVFVNPAFTEMTGYAAAEVMGETPRILQGPRTDRAVLKRLRYTLERGEEFTGEAINYRKDGTEFHLEWQVAPLRDAAGKITHFVALQRDVSERKRLETQLIESQKMETVGKLAGGIAHEFNSILTAIIGQSELLLADLTAGSSLADSANEISKAANRAATLTRQLLAYGRKQLLRPEALDLNRVVAGMEGIFQHLMGGGVDTRIVLAPNLRAVKADAGQIEQVIMNMVINARDAMPNGGKLTLETAPVSFDEDTVGRYPELKPGDYVMLAISDTGMGMRPQIQARVFEPFFTTKDVGQGTGLGLSTCYGIIKQSGGHISVYSEAGRGTTFKVYLPQVGPPPKIPIQRLFSPELPRGTETILLAEDDPALREMGATLLRRLGYTVLLAANGVEGLSLSHQPGSGSIDLLFTDLVMPQMSGKELAERVRAVYPRTRILFASAYTEQAIAHQGVLDEGMSLLQKPFTPAALAQKIRSVLDQPISPSR